MAKTIIKELIIFLLLCLSIILLLGIVLYEYVPMSKTIPNPVSYTTPDGVKQELATTDSIDEAQIITTYQVDATDLNNYKRTQEYKPGKADPFASYQEQTNGEQTGTDSSKTDSTENTSSGSDTTKDNSNTTSGGQYFQDKGTK